MRWSVAAPRSWSRPRSGSSRIDEDDPWRATREILADPADAVVVTTAIGFRGWLDAADAAGLAEDLLAVLDGAASSPAGPRPAGPCRPPGCVADWVAESETSAEIADFLLAEGVAGARIAVQHHGAGDDGSTTADRRAGPSCRGGLPLGSAARPRRGRGLRAAGCGRLLDAVVFTSAPGASAWLRELVRSTSPTRSARSSRTDGCSSRPSARSPPSRWLWPG